MTRPRYDDDGVGGCKYVSIQKMMPVGMERWSIWAVLPRFEETTQWNTRRMETVLGE